MYIRRYFEKSRLYLIYNLMYSICCKYLFSDLINFSFQSRNLSVLVGKMMGLSLLTT